MPCRDDYSDQLDLINLRERLDRATRVACELSKLLGSTDNLSQEAISWIAEHYQMDKDRKAREKAARDLQRKRKAALAKLTEEEKELLELDD
jgi:small-conductance mechanosensitive channel